MISNLPQIKYFQQDHSIAYINNLLNFDLVFFSYENYIYYKLINITNKLFLNDIKDIFIFNFNNCKNIEVVLIHKGTLANLTNELYLYNISIYNIIKIIYFFKKHTLNQYKLLLDIIFIDQFKINLNIDKRFIKYHLLSILYNQRLTIVSYLKNYSLFSITSLINLYKTAGWYEREIWDLYGIFFIDNSDLKQILTDYCFNTYPFKKNFPLVGYLEIRYDYNIKKIQYEPIKLSYIYRSFNFLTGWEWL